jgi:hypothetical protein
MRTSDIDKIRKILESEYVDILFKRYFNESGLENLNMHIYPPAMMDIGARIPQMADKIEVEPSVQSFDTGSGVVQLRWNLFVLGNNRMLLGDTVHRSLNELKIRAMVPPEGMLARSSPTASDVIKFIKRVLSDSKDEVVHPCVTSVPFVPTERPRLGQTLQGGYYEKRRPVL